MVIASQRHRWGPDEPAAKHSEVLIPQGELSPQDQLEKMSRWGRGQMLFSSETIEEDGKTCQTASSLQRIPDRAPVAPEYKRI